jgi:hypothetical protein
MMGLMMYLGAAASRKYIVSKRSKEGGGGDAGEEQRQAMGVSSCYDERRSHN